MALDCCLREREPNELLEHGRRGGYAPHYIANQYLNGLKQQQQQQPIPTLPSKTIHHAPPQTHRQQHRPTPPSQNKKPAQQFNQQTHHHHRRNRHPPKTTTTHPNPPPPLSLQTQNPLTLPISNLQNNPPRPTRTNPTLGQCARPGENSLGLRAAAVGCPSHIIIIIIIFFFFSFVSFVSFVDSNPPPKTPPLNLQTMRRRQAIQRLLQRRGAFETGALLS